MWIEYSCICYHEGTSDWWKLANVIVPISLFLWSTVYESLLMGRDIVCMQLGQPADSLLSLRYPLETFGCRYSISTGSNFPDPSCWIDLCMQCWYWYYLICWNSIQYLHLELTLLLGSGRFCSNSSLKKKKEIHWSLKQFQANDSSITSCQCDKLKNEVFHIFHKKKTKMLYVMQLISRASGQVKCWSINWRNSVYRCLCDTVHWLSFADSYSSLAWCLKVNRETDFKKLIFLSCFYLKTKLPDFVIKK